MAKKKKTKAPTGQSVFADTLERLIELASERRDLDERIDELRQDLLDRYGERYGSE